MSLCQYSSKGAAILPVFAVSPLKRWVTVFPSALETSHYLVKLCPMSNFVSIGLRGGVLSCMPIVKSGPRATPRN